MFLFWLVNDSSSAASKTTYSVIATKVLLSPSLLKRIREAENAFGATVFYNMRYNERIFESSGIVPASLHGSTRGEGKYK